MTGPVVSLSQAKAALRVDHDDQDVLIQQFLDAAIEESFCLADALDQDEVTAATLPPTVRTAILLHVIRMYEESEGAAPAGSIALASRHRSWVV